MAPSRKSAATYEAEAEWVGACLVHPTHGVARRLYQERHGILRSNLYVCHTCDVPRCILDAHHFVGTCRDNVLDAVTKGRHSSLRKGGARFSGTQSADVRAVISEASKRTWGGLSDMERQARIDRAASGRAASTRVPGRASDASRRGWLKRKGLV